MGAALDIKPLLPARAMALPPGLTAAEAARLLARDGPNEITREEGTPAWRMLLAQFNSPVIWLLLGACVASSFLREVADAVAIGAIVILNAVVGFVQEFRAERAVLALRAMTAPRARVVRDGRPAQVAANEVVVGDVLLLESGDIVAADATLLQANRLSANEAALTGESAPSEKSTQASAAGAPIAERSDQVFMGTHIASGAGVAEVKACAMQTELGKIAHLIESAEDSDTPLQVQLAKVGRVLLLICLGIVSVVAALGLWRGLPVFDVFLTAVSLAVAAVPEGLPAVVTIALAIGVRRMASRHVLVRKLPAVETLGSASVICTDKTGTLTTGQMTVRELWGKDQQALLFAAAAGCDVELAADGKSGVGDSTEVAILLAAQERGIDKRQLEAQAPRVAVNPFESERKRMSIQRADGTLYVKGATEVLLGLCTRGTEGAAEANTALASRGLRVLAVATGQGPTEEALTLLGLVGIADPPRPEAIAAVAAAKAAGITTVMITGDHPATARAIALELGIGVGDTDGVPRVHARASPADKLRIVKEWKQQGAVVAMTGDGVNDAPALREAHIGICMGKTGTEVTREAADMVLTDDNFASIVAAVKEGRGIFDNIRKALVYLLIGNTSELAVMLVASLVGLPIPLLPLQLLWINLVTDGLPALGLVMENADPDVMTRPPRGANEPILGWREWRKVLLTATLEGGLTVATFFWALQTHTDDQARSIAFSVLVFAELFRAFAARSTRRVFFEVGVFTNRTLLGVVALSVVIQLALPQFEVTQKLFRMGPLSWLELGVAVGVGLVPVTALEVAKLWWRAVRRLRTRGG